MVWLDLIEENGSGIYLDIRHIESRGRGEGTTFAISGVLGDGRAEAEVLVEVEEAVEVTFVDEWLDTGRLHDLFSMVDREALLTAVAARAGEMSFCLESFPSLEGRPRQRVSGYRAGSHWLPVRPGGYGEQLELPLTVAAPPPSWAAVA